MTTLRALPARTLAGLATLSAAAFVAVTTETLPTGLLPQIATGLHVSQATAGTLIGAYALVVALGSVPLAVLTARLPRRTLILATIGVYAASGILSSLAPDFGFAVGARVLGGAAHAVFFAVASAFAARLVPPHLVGRAVAVLQVGGSLALIVGTPLGTAVGLAAGWRSAFLLLATAAIVLLLVASRLLPEVLSSEAVSWAQAVRSLRTPGLPAIAVVAALAFTGHYAAYTYISPLLRRGGVSDVAGVLLLFGLGGMIGVWVSGTAADRFPRQALIGSFCLLPLVMLGVYAFRGVTAGTVAVAIVWSTAFVCVPTLIMTSALRVGFGNPDMAGALVNSACNVGIAGGSFVGGGALTTMGLAGVPPVAAVAFLATLALAVAAGSAFGLPEAHPEMISAPAHRPAVVEQGC